MEAARNTWTDDRLDDLAVRTEAGFAESAQRDRELQQDIRTLGSELHAEIRAQDAKIDALGRELREEIKTQGKEFRTELNGQGGELRGEMKGLGVELRSEIHELRGEMRAGFARLDRRFDMLTWTVVAAFVSAIASHFL